MSTKPKFLDFSVGIGAYNLLVVRAMIYRVSSICGAHHPYQFLTPYITWFLTTNILNISYNISLFEDTKLTII